MSDLPSVMQARLLEGPLVPTRLARDKFPQNSALLLEVGCHMIVKLVASSPAYFPSGNGKVGIMDSDLSHLQPGLKHNWVGYAVGVAAVVAILPKQQAAAC